MSQTPAWEGVHRADLVGGTGPTDRPRLSSAEEGFCEAWGRAALREDDAGEHADYPGFGGAV